MGKSAFIGVLCVLTLCSCRSIEDRRMSLRDLIDPSELRPLAEYLRNGGDPNAVVREDGERLLHFAAVIGAETAVRMLLDAGADASVEYFAETALDLAARDNEEAICRLLAKPDAEETREEARMAIALKAFKKGMWVAPKDTYILEIDGRDPDERILKELQSLGYHVKAASESNHEATVAQPRLRLTFSEWIDDRNVRVVTELDRGPLAGGICEDVVRKRYGCWVMFRTSSSIY
jgi:predicted short-subunit dehydrogenase-like oxidoreductase (DUF2520 family)